MLPLLGLVTGSLHRKGATQTGPFGLPVFGKRRFVSEKKKREYILHIIYLLHFESKEKLEMMIM
jgi:hypothetical protein